MLQQEYSLIAEWEPTAVLNSDYHNYATVIMGTPLQWEREHMFAVWEKSKFTVTVNDGTKVWFTFLLRSGIDVHVESNKKYVPNLVIIRDRDLFGQLSTIVDLFRSLGSSILHVPDQNSTDYFKVLDRVSDCAYYRQIKLKEMYIFAHNVTNDEGFGIDTTTLYEANGEVDNIRVIIITHLYSMWILQPGVHKIHVPKKQMLLKPLCGVLPDPAFCRVTSCSTNGLEYNLNNASVRDIMQSPFHTTYAEEIVTVETDDPILWVMGLDISGEDIPKASNESTD